MRLGMHTVQQLKMEACVYNLHESLKKARDEYTSKKAFGTIAI